MHIKVLLQTIKWSSAARRWISKCCCKGLSDWLLQEDEDQSVAAKDRVIECCSTSKMKIWCCKRWCSSTEDVEDVPVTVPIADDCWKISMMYRCITLMLLKMHSLLSPTVDVVIVSIIPFSLRGGVEIL